MTRNHVTTMGLDGIAKPRNHRRLFRILAFGLLLAMTGCKTVAQPTRYIVFLDVSASITQTQRDLWLKTLRESVLHAVMPGDRLTVFAMHGQTSNAAPLYDTILSPASLGETQTGLVKLRREIAMMRRDSAKAVSEALVNGGHAKHSDIVGALDRVHADPRYPRTDIVIVSDMINSTPELDLEKQRLEPGRIQELAGRLVSNHKWSADSLQGARVYCLLNSVSDDDPPTVNNRAVLHEFWQVLAQSIGGELATFETHLDRTAFTGGQS